MKKFAFLVLGASLALTSMAGSASAGDLFGVKKRATAREEARHAKTNGIMENTRKKSIAQTANSKDHDLGTKLELIKQTNQRHEGRKGVEKLRHQDKLADIQSRNSLGMKKPAARPAARPAAKPAAKPAARTTKSRG